MVITEDNIKRIIDNALPKLRTIRKTEKIKERVLGHTLLEKGIHKIGGQLVVATQLYLYSYKRDRVVDHVANLKELITQAADGDDMVKKVAAYIIVNGQRPQSAAINKPNKKKRKNG